jgi:hypothetical protein
MFIAVASVLISSGRQIYTAITAAEILALIFVCIFVLAECTISGGANGVISRHGCGDQSFAEVELPQMLIINQCNRSKLLR